MLPVSGVPREPSGVGSSSSHLMTKAITGLVSSLEMVTDAQERAHSVVGSSQRQSSAAMRMVMEERKEREKEKRQFEERIRSLEASLHDQMKVSREAVSAVSSMKQQLDAAQLEARRQSHFHAGSLLVPHSSLSLSIGDPTIYLSHYIERAEQQLRASQSQTQS